MWAKVQIETVLRHKCPNPGCKQTILYSEGIGLSITSGRMLSHCAGSVQPSIDSQKKPYSRIFTEKVLNPTEKGLIAAKMNFCGPGIMIGQTATSVAPVSACKMYAWHMHSWSKADVPFLHGPIWLLLQRVFHFCWQCTRAQLSDDTHEAACSITGTAPCRVSSIICGLNCAAS